MGDAMPPAAGGQYAGSPVPNRQENGETCRTTSQVVYANGDLRRQGEHGKCTG